MRAVLGFLGSTPFLTVLVTAMFSACLWLFGPFLAFGSVRPLDGVWERVGVLSGLWLSVILLLVVRWLRRRAKNRALAEDLVAEDPSETAIAEELSELKAKLKGALAKLRKSKSGQRHLYELPWYVIIGPPGAGKTTAIVNSGLKFPLADDGIQSAIGGVGGTRNCDWWFTNDAVLIDTAGRYTTQESDAAADNAAWLGFLQILKKHRTRQPINGAIVAISLSDLSMQDHETQMSHARAVRRRILELRERLGIRFPIYVLFTKADLIAGFTEFFDPLSKEDRAQVWGFTFDLAASRAKEAPLARFDEEFGLLLSRVNAQSLERMQAERDPARRSLVAGFPTQLASFRQVAQDFLAEAFQESRFEDRLPLRGIYFASGTQEGTPIDRLMMGMARTFGIGRQAIGTGQGTGKSFFITDLFERVIFPEAGLVSLDDRVERRYRWVVRGSIAAAAGLSVTLGVFWVQSFLGNRELIATAEDAIAAYRLAEADIPANPIADTDLPAVVPALNILRDMPGNPVLNAPEPAWTLGFGLYQGEVIGTNAAQSYRASLNRHFLPRLILRLEEQIQSNLNQPEFLYEALKVYLTLGLQAPYTDTDLVVDWMEADWSIAYPGPGRAGLRSDLSDHLTALLGQPMQAVELNGPMVAMVQALLAELSLAERIYNGILSSGAAKGLPPWRVTDIGGPAVSRVMTRSNGEALSDGIPGIFTYRGFHEVFLNEALGVASRVQKESWVLGEAGAAEQNERALAQMSRDVLALYYDDYISAYDAILGDLDIIPLQSLSHAVEVTQVLSGPTSPIVNILEAVADETRLTEDRSAVPGEAVAEGQAAAVTEGIDSIRNRRARLLADAIRRASPGEDAEAELSGQYVEDRFTWLHDLVRSEGGAPSALDGIIVGLQAVYDEMRGLGQTGAGAAPDSEGGGALGRFQDSVSRIQGPLQRWASQVSTGSSGIQAEGTRAQIDARWQSQVLPFCSRALDGKYPFNAQARDEVTIQDFTRAFAPSGLIDTFFSENLLRYVNTNTSPWQWRTVNQAELGISDAVLAQFENAAAIRDTFFAGNPVASIPFELTPYALDPTATSMTLEIDGQSLSFNQGDSQTPKAFRWPGEFGLGRLSFQPPSNTVETEIKRDGPWAWFRLLNAAAVRQTASPQVQRVTFRVGGRLAQVEMRMGSAFNPFTLPALSQFRCPKGL